MTDIVELLRNAEFGSDGYSLLMMRSADEIESLRAQVEKYHKAQQDFYIPNAALRAQVAELEKERDEWKESAINGGNAGYLREKVAELEKELREPIVTNVEAWHNQRSKTVKYLGNGAETRTVFHDINAANGYISELEKERDKYKNMPIKYKRMEFNARLQDELTAAQARIVELEKERGYDPVAISENTMNKYRNAVIDECIDIAMESNSPVTEMTELKR